MKMRTVKKSEIYQQFCAFEHGSRCTENCMACIEVHGRIERENHSGGMQRMQEAAMKRGRLSRDIIREGRKGSTEEVLILEAEYGCARLMGGTNEVSTL